jgi:hypothetical protein
MSYQLFEPGYMKLSKGVKLARFSEVPRRGRVATVLARIISLAA